MKIRLNQICLVFLVAFCCIQADFCFSVSSCVPPTGKAKCEYTNGNLLEPGDCKGDKFTGYKYTCTRLCNYTSSPMPPDLCLAPCFLKKTKAYQIECPNPDKKVEVVGMIYNDIDSCKTARKNVKCAGYSKQLDCTRTEVKEIQCVTPTPKPNTIDIVPPKF